MFSGCSSFTSLPDISKWNTKNIKNMNYLFSRGSSLESIPDISIWYTENLENIQGLFDDCSSSKVYLMIAHIYKYYQIFLFGILKI